MYLETFQQMQKMLGSMDAWLVAAEAHAKGRAFDPKNYLSQRLAPDQFPLVQQVQIACDSAKLGAARVSGKEAPSFPDDEDSIEKLRERVAKTRAFLGGLSAADFAAASTRVVSLPRWEGKTMTAANYFAEYAVPNFYFHLTHVYAILRHNGVGLGKRDYLGTLSFDAPSGAKA
ncbi:MAG: DUF1993 domain-containing protein [Polyangiales bacterium]|nr:DUF1993 domain-containing protein [Myxococcales bacterium]